LEPKPILFHLILKILENFTNGLLNKQTPCPMPIPLAPRVLYFTLTGCMIETDTILKSMSGGVRNLDTSSYLGFDSDHKAFTLTRE
jgi:hypothetical protein